MIELSDKFSRGYALVIGVGADLPVTIQDAKAVASIFSDPQRCAYPPGRVHLLTEEAAGRDGVVSALRSLAAELTADDTLTVYYSGHGVAAGNERYFLLTHGADHTQLDETALDGHRFTELLLAVPARRLLLLLDCCRAGGIFDRTVGKAAPVVRPDIPVDMEDVLARGSGTVVVASSAAHEISLIKGGYSIFTYALIEALCGVGAANRDGYVYASDLAMHTGKRVPALTEDRQHPTLTFRQADNYPVAYYAAGGVTPKGVPQGLVPPETTPAIDVKTVLRSIREFLLELPMEPREVQVMVEDMGLRDVALHYDSGPRVYWDKLLRVAHLRWSMDMVFRVLDPQFGDNPHWAGLKAQYRAVRTSREKLPSSQSAKVLPLTRQAERFESRAATDPEVPSANNPADLADVLLAQATNLLSEIQALSGAGSDTGLRTAAVPVRLRIADMIGTIGDLTNEMANDGAADFVRVNATALIQEKFDLINALLDHRQPRRQVDRLVEAGNAVLAAADRLAHALRERPPGSDNAGA